jgi:membrane-bound serine protease (ClpP class)
VTSYLRKEFRATAEQRGRPPEIAEAMVDADVAIPGLVAEGKLLTLTTWEALAHGIADFRAEDTAGVVEYLGLETAELRRPAPNWAERLVGFLALPMVGSLLLSVGTLALLMAVRSPGFGVIELVGVACLALFFWSRWILRLVGWEELALIVTGSALLALEVFVIPGFGVAGVLGAILLFLGLTLSLVGQGVTFRGLVEAAGQIALAALLALAGGVVLLRALPHLPFGRRIVLKTGLGEGGGDARPSQGAPIRAGARGTALSPLRPAGIAEIAGTRTDVVSDGEYVPSGEPIEVIRLDENRIVVRRAPPPRGHVG